MKEKINLFLEKYIYKILLIFMIMQPILDVATAISLKCFNINLTIGAVIRLIFMMFITFYLLFFNTTKYKKLSLITTIIIYIYIIIFSIVCYKNLSFSVLSYEIRYALNTFYLPIVFLGLLNMFKQYKIKFNVKYLVYILTIYLLFIIIPDLTNTSFASYSHSKLGNVGWFLSANAIGSIFSFLLPILILYICNVKKEIIYKVFMILSTLYIIVNIGTKAPVLSVLVIIGLNLIYFFVKFIKEKKYKNIFVLLLILSLLLGGSIIAIPKTSFYKNIQIHKNFLSMESYTEIFTDYYMINNLVFSERLTFLNNTNKAYNNSSIEQKIFGIGYIENYNTKDISYKTIEMDYFDIFYRHGIIGFLLYFAVFIYGLVLCLNRLFKDIDFKKIEYLSIIVLILLLSLFSGHILVTPSVSIYIALIFNIIIYNQYLEGIKK